MPPIPGHTQALYCEAIWLLGEDGESSPSRVSVARTLGIGRASAQQMLDRLVEMGLLGRRRMTLTAKGVRVAEELVRARRVAETYLHSFLGVSLTDLYETGDRWKAALDPAIETAMLDALGHPTVCPHGNPIPGEVGCDGAARPVACLEPGARFRLERIRHELVRDRALVSYLETSGLVPGELAAVRDVGPDGTIVVETPAGSVAISAHTGERLLGVPA